MNSLWKNEIEKNQILDLPPHKSRHYIDIDFLRNLLFVYSENHQKGIESLLRTDEQNNQSKRSIVNEFHLQLNAEPYHILRVCFDFDNDKILIKDDNGTESFIHFLNLENHKERILNIIGLKTFFSNELNKQVRVN